jgi:large subunit ribosomal protein L6
MSRIGKQLIDIPQTVNVEINDNQIHVSGKLGKMSHPLTSKLKIEVVNNTIKIQPVVKDKDVKAFWGMYRSKLQNMVTGVSRGFRQELNIIGVGYRAALEGKNLNLQLGYSHPIQYPLPDEIKVEVDKNTRIIVSGVDKALVGKVCRDIRDYRPPEPYKGKGVRIADEYVLRKEGKKK